MFAIVEVPEFVRHYSPSFASVFSSAGLEQFERYVRGLILSENKTVDGINRIFAIEVRNQSSLNRWLSENSFTVPELNQARMDLLASLPGTRIKSKGVLSVDDTLLTHHGKRFEKIACLYDHVHKCYAWAHNLVNLHYSDDQTDWPVNFRLWEPAETERLEAGFAAAGVRLRPDKLALKTSAPKKWRKYLLSLWQRHQNKPEVRKAYQSKLLVAERLLSEFFADSSKPRLPVTFDTWYTQPALCRLLDKTLKVPCVGTLSDDDHLFSEKGKQRLDVFARQLKADHEQALRTGGEPVFQKVSIPYKGTKEVYYSYCRTHCLANFGKQRLVLNHRKADLSDPGKFFVSNRLNWNAFGITRIRRHRWPVEVYHEEGKADGPDQHQVRDFKATEKHVALIAVTYSLLRMAQHDQALLRKLQRHLQIELGGTAGTWRRNAKAQALLALGTFIATALSQGQPLNEVMKPLLATVLR